MMILRAVALLCAFNALAGSLGSGAAQPAVGADWPQWRGPTRNGIVPAGPKLADSWPQDGPKLLWKSGPIPSAQAGGVGSIAVASGRAFVYVNWRHLAGKLTLAPFLNDLKDVVSAETLEQMTRAKDVEFAIDQRDVSGSRVGNNFTANPSVKWKSERESEKALAVILEKLARFEDVIVCLDATSGKELWKRAFPGTYTTRWGQANHWGASGTPTIAGDKCYVAGSAGLYCLAVADGDVVWQARIDFTNSSPLVAYDAVYLQTPELKAFNAQTGQLLWSRALGGDKFQGANFSPIAWTNAGQNYVLGSSGAGLFCVQADNGKLLWQGPKLGEGSSTPVLSSNVVVVDGVGGAQAFKISPQGAERLWAQGNAPYHPSTPIIYQDHVYLIDASVTRCLHLQTGAVKWTERKGVNYSSALLADGKVFAYQNLSHGPMHLMMYRATAGKFELLGEFHPPSAECSSPALADGKLYLRLHDCVACYDVTAAGTSTALDKPSATAGQRQARGRIAFPVPDPQLPMPRTSSPEPVGWSKNWPRFRGPTGDGVAAADADPPIRVDLATDLIFKEPVPKGHSSPIIWGDRIFLTGEGHRIMAFDRAKGKILWDTALQTAPAKKTAGDDEFEPLTKDTGMAASTPCTDGERVYAFFGSGVLGCVDLDGKQIWAQRLLSGKPRNLYGLASSPVLYGDQLIQVVDLGHGPGDKLSFIVALRARDGTPVWGQDRPVRSAWSTPLLYRGLAGDELITSASPWVIAYQPRTGIELWRAKEPTGDVAASPVACTERIYVPGGEGGTDLLAIKPGGRGDVSKTAIAWTSDASLPDAASPICDGKRYFQIDSSGYLYCLDAQTGKELWKPRLLGGSCWASPVLVGRRLYVINKVGEMFVISTTDGEEKSRVELPEGVSASPAILGGRIYVRTSGHLLCIGKK
jgi:outer membrane protein assembly factor BamB